MNELLQWLLIALCLGLNAFSILMVYKVMDAVKKILYTQLEDGEKIL